MEKRKYRQALQWGQCNSIEAFKKSLDAPDCTPVAVSNFLVRYGSQIILSNSFLFIKRINLKLTNDENIIPLIDRKNIELKMPDQ